MLPWRAERRDAIVTAIAGQVGRRRCPSCAAMVSDRWIELRQSW